jgi:hypothetical protein
MRGPIPFAVLIGVGCSGEETCGLEGDYLGQFDGADQGQVDLVVMTVGDQRGQVDFRMVGPTLELLGSSSLDCTTGSFTMPLEDPSGQEVGDALGSLGTQNGSGEWSLFSGSQGTWNY